MSHDERTEKDQAAEARKGLFDSVAGKAKEVAGAVTGKSDLAEEGQLQQADARARKQANADDAVADAKAKAAAEELRGRTEAAAKTKQEAAAKAGRQEAAAVTTADAEKAAAESRAKREESADRQAAEAKADAVARDHTLAAARLAEDADNTADAAHKQQARLNQEALDSERRAQQLRAEANSE